MASALAVWGMARAFGGQVWLRIEDHDVSRSRPEFARAILEDLEWLGFFADGPVIRQSERGSRYEEALSALEAAGLVYPCACSRKEIESTLDPSAGELRYPGTCRDRKLDGEAHRARRIRLDRRTFAFRDLRLGALEQTPSEQGGDVLARDRHGQWTYQFAVVVDDLEQGVDLVIRGEDLLASTGRQIQIASLLGRRAAPLFLHHPLIARPDGAKLSKANQDTGIRELRAAGWSIEGVLGAAAAALGLGDGSPAGGAQIVSKIERLAGS